MAHLRRLGGPAAARATEQELRGFLGSFGFSGDRVFEPVGPFSGGEKARLVLALVSYLRPNLLLLDEPTNHLDLEMRQALAVALQDYAAAVVLVSHDRHLLRAFADELLLVHDGRVAPFDGDLDDYANWFATSGEAKDSTAANSSTSSPAEDRKQRKREEAERRARLSPLRAEVSKYEKQIQRLEAERATIDAQLMEPELYVEGASAKARELMQRRGEVAALLSELETAWLEVAERLEKETAQQAG
jgi:ATP-binding cassette, subfamily F, member 3